MNCMNMKYIDTFLSVLEIGRLGDLRARLPIFSSSNKGVRRIGCALLAAVLMLCSGAAQAQGRQPGSVGLTAYGLMDSHLATGLVGGGAVLADWQASQGFALSGGFEYASSNRISAKLEGSATLLTTKQGYRLSLENGYLWRHYPELNLQEFTGALQLGWYANHVRLHLGLCNRYIAALVQRSDVSATILEPMNVMFAAEGWLFPLSLPKSWNVGLRWSNYGDFVVERVADWYFSAKGWYSPCERLRVIGEVGTHPTGSLNLTASYDGWYGHLGVTFDLQPQHKREPILNQQK